MYVIIIDKLFT